MRGEILDSEFVVLVVGCAPEQLIDSKLEVSYHAVTIELVARLEDSKYSWRRIYIDLPLDRIDDPDSRLSLRSNA
jgi:hypothetical protein